MLDLRRDIRDVPDFPKPGILFKDITPLLGDGQAFRASIDGLRDAVSDVPCDATRRLGRQLAAGDHVLDQAVVGDVEHLDARQPRAAQLIEHGHERRRRVDQSELFPPHLWHSPQ